VIQTEVRPVPWADLTQSPQGHFNPPSKTIVTFSFSSGVLSVSEMQKPSQVILDSALIQPDDQDIGLARQAREGSRAAFDLLFQQHRQFVYNVCYRMLGSADDAVDLTQITFIQAYREIRRFRGDACFRTWLYRIAVNQCITLMRRESRRRRLAEAEPVKRDPTGDDRVWEVILKLEPQHRAVLVLHYFQGLSCIEMAKALGCLGGAVRTRLHRARVAFRKQYEEMEK